VVDGDREKDERPEGGRGGGRAKETLIFDKDSKKLYVQ
jgi:hypothetical protein